MKIEPRYYIFHATFLAFKEAPWKSCTPVSYLPDAIIFRSPKRKAHNIVATVALKRWAHVSAGRDGWAARNSKWQSQMAEGTAPLGGARVGNGLPLQLRAHRGVGGETVPHAGTNASVNQPGIQGCKLAVPVQKITGLLCLTTCRWKTTGNVSRSGFESWPIATINKKLKSFTVCTYSF